MVRGLRPRYVQLPSWHPHPSIMLPQNAYHTELGLDPSPLMAVDLMHDAELGLEKQVLLHHLRIFNAVGKGTVEEFDARFVPLKAQPQPQP